MHMATPQVAKQQRVTAHTRLAGGASFGSSLRSSGSARLDCMRPAAQGARLPAELGRSWPGAELCGAEDAAADSAIFFYKEERQAPVTLLLTSKDTRTTVLRHASAMS
jgi:hypothetical protein